MNKKDILKAFPDYEEIDNSEFDRQPVGSKCLIICEDSTENNIYLKPKQKFPIVFEDDYYKIEVMFDGEFIIENKICATDKFNFLRSIPLLEQAIAKSKEIRGLK